ncbi:L-idonate 5-dehydrogenase [Pseudoclavibacter sp. RFBJ3]|uniref:L-idonate 5-dehydrogenase n=1 Tax=unclassified Pseudoclavibacter TaxID=2615177 RepID=UPI000CE87E24|nr:MULTISPECIES: L-idonate 5-dehydrogenase [unclassified Pseudoclavibacter]PPF83857.1 L-idonate 5-dehydrogenase [Pseudoclavibacter sp. RFBJ5]PPF92137.1 L-idonate 5-dehydrogenase [Pseudoclavibacter sp. RFBJ3]PPF97000.1 L-idonate 5-dehydrogenase [Pseudoclavibacter sp. RFBH5]PPG23687.1 L-idonate 5-dehydrogenase [Pseudoclavibacter sp. RFBI4]
MRAAFIESKEALDLAEVDTPEPGEGQVRIRVDYVGICGSDLHYYFEGANGAFVVREPLVPGHELSGRVDLDPLEEFETGAPVTVHPATFGTPSRELEDSPHLWPGGAYLGSASTTPHTQGALSEYLLVDRGMLRRLPATLPVRRAVLAEPLAVALHAVTKAGDLTGKRVLVTGAGPIGLLTIAAARVKGAAHISATDVLAGPLARASAMGAVEVIDVSRERVPADSFDVVFECSGVAVSVSSAFAAAKPAGTVVQVGMVPNEPRPINLAPFISKELRVFGTFRFKDEIDEAIVILDAHPEIEEVITHEVRADDTVTAFGLARNSEESGKVIVAVWPEG